MYFRHSHEEKNELFFCTCSYDYGSMQIIVFNCEHSNNSSMLPVGTHLTQKKFPSRVALMFKKNYFMLMLFVRRIKRLAIVGFGIKKAVSVTSKSGLLKVFAGLFP